MNKRFTRNLPEFCPITEYRISKAIRTLSGISLDVSSYVLNIIEIDTTSGILKIIDDTKEIAEMKIWIEAVTRSEVWIG